MNANVSIPTGPANAIPTLPIQLPKLDDTFGALFIGMCLCILLYGLTLHQTYRYYRLYPQDQRWLKFMVFFILISETLHTIMLIHSCYYDLVSNYFNPAVFAIDIWSLKLVAPISVVVMCLCQGFYIRRVYMISPKYRGLVALAVVLLLTEFGFMVYLTVMAFVARNLEEFEKVTWVVSVIYGLAVSVDLIVTVVLITVLLKSRTGFKSTDSLVQTLIIYSINSGLVTSIAGMLSFIFALVISGNEIYIAMGVVATKLYANSVLAVLNTRRSLSESTMDGFTIDSGNIGGNLQPALSSAVFAEQSTRPVTLSLPQTGEGNEASQMHSGSDVMVGEMTGSDKV